MIIAPLGHSLRASLPALVSPPKVSGSPQPKYRNSVDADPDLSIQMIPTDLNSVLGRSQFPRSPLTTHDLKGGSQATPNHENKTKFQRNRQDSGTLQGLLNGGRARATEGSPWRLYD